MQGDRRHRPLGHPSALKSGLYSHRAATAKSHTRGKGRQVRIRDAERRSLLAEAAISAFLAVWRRRRQATVAKGRVHAAVQLRYGRSCDDVKVSGEISSIAPPVSSPPGQHLVVLSHAGVDTTAARTLPRCCGATGFVWFDNDSLQPGDRWMETLEQAIQQSSAMRGAALGRWRVLRIAGRLGRAAPRRPAWNRGVDPGDPLAHEQPGGGPIIH